MQASRTFFNLLHLVLFGRPGKQGSALLRSLGLCEPVLDEELEQRPPFGRGTAGILRSARGWAAVRAVERHISASRAPFIGAISPYDLHACALAACQRVWPIRVMHVFPFLTANRRTHYQSSLHNTYLSTSYGG